MARPRGLPKTGGRSIGTPNKRSTAKAEAMAKAAVLLEEALPEAFVGDSHALLVATYKNTQIDLAVRIAAAKAALPYERAPLAAVKPQGTRDDFVPLAERLKAYAREAQIEASGGKVVELGMSQPRRRLTHG